MALIAQYQSDSPQQSNDIGGLIAQQLNFPDCVYLQGEMGAGKTLLCKSIIQKLGYIGEVTSPTYNLIHEYPVTGGVIFHMDLYRLNDPQELEFLAIADLWQSQSLFLIEWPHRGAEQLVPATKAINIEISESDSNQRNIALSSVSKIGN